MSCPSVISFNVKILYPEDKTYENNTKCVPSFAEEFAFE
jgi:hypothetical protein